MSRTMMKTKSIKSIDFSGNSFIIQGFGVISFFTQKRQDVSFHMAYPGYLRICFATEKKAFVFAQFWSIVDHFHRKSMGNQ